MPRSGLLPSALSVFMTQFGGDILTSSKPPLSITPFVYPGKSLENSYYTSEINLFALDQGLWAVYVVGTC